MKLQKIINDYRTYRRAALEDWTLSEILTALFDKVVSLEGRMDVVQLLDQTRFAVYSLVDIAFGPDRVCEFHVLTVDDKLVGMATRQGKGDWEGHVLDLENYKHIAGELAAAVVREDLERMPDVNSETDLSVGKHYLQFLDAEETMFVLGDPRSVYRLNEMPQRHRTYFVDEDGHAHRVESIGDFKQKFWVDGKPPRGNQVSIKIGGVEREADARQLMFELVRKQGNLKAALERYHQTASWLVTEQAPRVNRLVLSLTVPNNWDTRKVWVEFKSPEALYAFLTKYPPGQRVQGPFDAAVLQPDGHVYDLNTVG